MKIELGLPDWVDERHLRVFAGIELVAYKHFGDDKWKIKTGRCKSCGDCCADQNTTPFGNAEGSCIYLKDEPGGKRICSLGPYRPLACSAGDKQPKYDCTVEFEEQ